MSIKLSTYELTIKVDHDVLRGNHILDENQINKYRGLTQIFFYNI